MDDAGQQIRDLAVQIDSWVEQFNQAKSMAQVDQPAAPADSSVPLTQEDTQLNYKIPDDVKNFKTPVE